MKKILLTIALCAALLLSGCAAPKASDDSLVTPDEGRDLIKEGAVLVDVRTPEEYEQERIPGAINLPNETLSDAATAALPDKDAAIVLYCRTGRRTREAAQTLSGLGYTRVYDMGGIESWPYETESGAPEASVPAESAPAASDAPEEELPGIMSGFTATDLDGSPVDDSIFEGKKLTVINVWATYCGPCIQEMPDLKALSETYADRGVRVVGLVSDVLNYDGTISDSQISAARDIVESTGADYLHIVPSQDLMGLLMQITAVPTTFFVDETGDQVGSAYMGAKSAEAWGEIVDQLLAELDKEDAA